VVLLSVVADQVIDLLHVVLGQVGQQFAVLGRVYRFHQRGLLAAPDQVGIIAGAVGQRYQLVKEPPVPVLHPDRVYIFL
jgi:hypothetical protein